MFRKSLIVKNYIFIIPAVLAFLVLLISINKPFVGFHDFNNVQYGTMAQNYMKVGVWNLKFGQIMGKIHGDFRINKPFYTSYLPLAPLLTYASFVIFGVHEWSERIIPILFSTAGVFFFFWVCKKIWGLKAALMACVFYIFNPMFIYFGSMTVVDVLLLPFMNLSILFYLNFLEKGKDKYLVFLCVTLFVGGLIGWIIAYLGPLFILHSILLKKFKIKLLLTNLVIIFTVGLQFLHAYILSGGNLFSSAMFSSLKSRLLQGDLSFGGERFSTLSYLKKEFGMLQAYFTRTLIFLSLISTATELRRKINLSNATIIFFLILGLGHPVIFSRAVFIHDYQNIYLLPFFSISGALMLSKVTAFLKKIKISPVVIAGLILAALVLFISERMDFAKALLASDMNRQGQNMGKMLNFFQTRDDEAVIISPRFSSFYGLFTDFYSIYRYGILDEETFKKEGWLGYKFAVMIDEDISDKSFYNNLTYNNPHLKMGEWTLIVNAKK